MCRRFAERCRRFLLLVVLALVGLAGPAQAQPFGAWLTMSPGYPTSHGFVQIPHAGPFNITGNITIEAWVAITNSSASEDCRSIAGKNYLTGWWVGLCTISGRPTLRSYLRGGGSARHGGEIEPGRWTHIAVVRAGDQRLHYVNGELAATFPDAGALSINGDDVRIGSDAAWPRTPTGAIDEVRIWNTARTQGQIRANMHHPINTAQANLVGVWALDGNAQDVVGPRDGSLQGTGVGFLTFPVALDCGANTATSLCLLDRFSITARWRTNPLPGTLTDGQAQVAGCANEGSGLFQFFSPNNWEIMVKALNGCGLNSRYWIFSAATTNVFYRMEVFDIRAGQQRIYFNYPGPPAPAVTDTAAFATCP